MDAANEKQVITVGGGTGNWKAKYDGQTSANIAHNATAGTVQTALEGLSNIGAGQVGVTGDAGGPWTVEFKGTLAAKGVSEITIDNSGMTGGTVTAETTVPGRAADTTNLGVPMHTGHASEPQGPEDALGPGRKRGDYSGRGDGSVHYEGGVLQSYGPWNDHSDEPAKKGGVTTT